VQQRDAVGHQGLQSGNAGLLEGIVAGEKAQMFDGRRYACRGVFESRQILRVVRNIVAAAAALGIGQIRRNSL